MRTARSYSPSIYLPLRLESPSRYWLTCLALGVWWIASLYPLMAPQEVTEQLQTSADATAQGSRLNQVIDVSFAALGAIYLPAAIRLLRSRKEVRLPLYFLGAYLAWSGLTILWSDAPSLSIRRLGQFVLLVIGVVGLGAGFYSRTGKGVLTLARHAVYASWLAICVLVASRLWNQNLADLLSPDWNLKGDTGAVLYIYPVAYGFVAALVIYENARAKQVASLSLLIFVLLLLKGRSMLAGTMAASLLVFYLRSKRASATGPGLVGLILLVGQLDLATGGRLFLSTVNVITERLSEWLPYLTVGNGVDDLLTLDGRIPLWQTLWSYFTDRPLAGHGFGAFWNPDRFYEIYHAAGWPAVVAHNGFLDELLATGAIGLGLCLLFWLTSLRTCLDLKSYDSRAKHLTFGWLVLFLCFNSMGSLLQSYSEAPTLFSLTALFALLAQPLQYRSYPITVGHQTERAMGSRYVVPSTA